MFHNSYLYIMSLQLFICLGSPLFLSLVPLPACHFLSWTMNFLHTLDLNYWRSMNFRIKLNLCHLHSAGHSQFAASSLQFFNFRTWHGKPHLAAYLNHFTQSPSLIYAWWKKSLVIVQGLAWFTILSLLCAANGWNTNCSYIHSRVFKFLKINPLALDLMELSVKQNVTTSSALCCKNHPPDSICSNCTTVNCPTKRAQAAHTALWAGMWVHEYHKTS